MVHEKCAEKSLARFNSFESWNRIKVRAPLEFNWNRECKKYGEDPNFASNRKILEENCTELCSQLEGYQDKEYLDGYSDNIRELPHRLVLTTVSIEGVLPAHPTSDGRLHNYCAGNTTLIPVAINLAKRQQTRNLPVDLQNVSDFFKVSEGVKGVDLIALQKKFLEKCKPSHLVTIKESFQRRESRKYSAKDMLNLRKEYVTGKPAAQLP
jgi:hypothetical protein